VAFIGPAFLKMVIIVSSIYSVIRRNGNEGCTGDTSGSASGIIDFKFYENRMKVNVVINGEFF